MDKVFSQFRRIYSDNGSGDVDFSKAEEKLKLSHDRLTKATQELLRASERLNAVAMGAEIPTPDQMH